MTTNWQEDALCAVAVGVEPRWFEPFEGNEVGVCAGNPLTHPRIAVAVSVCARCPVREQCLEAGVSGGEQGVWGGQYLSKKTTQSKTVVFVRDDQEVA